MGKDKKKGEKGDKGESKKAKSKASVKAKSKKPKSTSSKASVDAEASNTTVAPKGTKASSKASLKPKSKASKTSVSSKKGKKEKKDGPVSKKPKSKSKHSKTKNLGDDSTANFAPNADSIAVPIVSKYAIEKNQADIDMLVVLLEAVRAEHVTRFNKDDLDKIQIMIKNIVYREAGEIERVQKVHFTELQKLICKKVAGGTNKTAEQLDQMITSVGGSKLTKEYQKLNLVPTCPSIMGSSGVAKKSKK